MLLTCAIFAAGYWRHSTNPVPALGGSVDSSPVVVYAAEPAPPPITLSDFVADSLFGLSGKLRVHLLPRSLSAAFPQLARALDRGPGVYPAKTDSLSVPFSFVALHPFSMKRGDKMGPYRMGFWPAELRYVSSSAYENPPGFIEVTQETRDLFISEHFRFRDFLTHDQDGVWPKYLVLREELLDKLELVITDLNVRGVPASKVQIMSGFRTPYHNERGIGGEGGARDSRHQYGDAADIIVDSDGNGRMDDLNFDGRVDLRDVDEVLAAVDRVERFYPDLVGGVGRYAAMGPSGPFAHIDVRGYRARWGTGTGARKAAAARPVRAQVARQGGTCIASGASAVLCSPRGSRTR